MWRLKLDRCCHPTLEKQHSRWPTLYERQFCAPKLRDYIRWENYFWCSMLHLQQTCCCYFATRSHCACGWTCICAYMRAEWEQGHGRGLGSLSEHLLQASLRLIFLLQHLKPVALSFVLQLFGHCTDCIFSSLYYPWNTISRGTNKWNSALLSLR